jgi:hypothetical protein
MDAKNISIGKDKWIEWVEFDSQNDDLFELDSLLKSTEKLWKALETECVVGCCGIYALRFWEEDIERAANKMDKNILRHNLLDLIKQLSEIESTILTSSMLNQLIDKGVFIRLLKHILNALSMKKMNWQELKDGL